MEWNQTSKILVGAGAFLILLGVFWQFGGRFLPLGKLPGDIAIEKENVRFYFPLATSIVLSILLSLVFYLFGKFGR
jgi:hypothetical protein